MTELFAHARREAFTWSEVQPCRRTMRRWIEASQGADGLDSYVWAVMRRAS